MMVFSVASLSSVSCAAVSAVATARSQNDELNEIAFIEVQDCTLRAELQRDENRQPGEPRSARVLVNRFREFVHLRYRPLIVAIGPAGETACLTLPDQSLAK